MKSKKGPSKAVRDQRRKTTLSNFPAPKSSDKTISTQKRFDACMRYERAGIWRTEPVNGGKVSDRMDNGAADYRRHSHQVRPQNHRQRPRPASLIRFYNITLQESKSQPSFSSNLESTETTNQKSLDPIAYRMNSTPGKLEARLRQEGPTVQGSEPREATLPWPNVFDANTNIVARNSRLYAREIIDNDEI